MPVVQEQPKRCFCCAPKNNEPEEPVQPKPGCLKGCKNSCSKCWDKHHPRFGPFYSCLAFEACCEACDKPGIGSKDFKGGNCDEDCPLMCLPCYIVADTLCFCPITFGCWEATWD